MVALATPSALTQSEKEGGQPPKPKESPTVQGVTIKQSVVAGGGGTSSGGSYRLEGTAGQPVVIGAPGTDTSSNPPYSLRSGFWPGAVPCPFVMTETTRLFNSGGGASALKIIATGDCAWTAVISQPWVVLTTTDTGTGSGVLAYEVRDNFTGAARQATITVGEYTDTIVQDGNIGLACGFAISPAFGTFPITGASSSINVTAAAGCAWEAESDSEWITITSGRVGIGSGTVTFAVAPGTPGSPRNGTIRAAGKNYAVKQQR
jgi:hypothetical protein